LSRKTRQKALPLSTRESVDVGASEERWTGLDLLVVLEGVQRELHDARADDRGGSVDGDQPEGRGVRDCPVEHVARRDLKCGVYIRDDLGVVRPGLGSGVFTRPRPGLLDTEEPI
jgi:hypothetical protein